MINYLINSTRRPDITFKSNGSISLSRRTSRLLGLRSGDVINVCTEQGRYYLYVAHHGQGLEGCHAAMCKPTAPGGRHFRAFSRRLCVAMLEAADQAGEHKLGVIVGDPVLCPVHGIMLPLFWRRISAAA